MTLCLGMSGPYVKTVQEFLAARSLYRGPADSSYGGGTSAAVKTYQNQMHLPSSGTVDAATWNSMFPGQPAPVSELLAKSLRERCLALTGSFETSSYPPESFCGLSGDFDKMGISFGACQWNIGQGTLQPLVEEMFEKYEDVARDIFHENSETLLSLKDASRDEQLVFARSIQSNGRINEPWRGMFISLGRTPEFQSVQIDRAGNLFTRALGFCNQYQLKSERGAALMFDIAVQNYSIGAIVNQAILKDFAKLPATGDNETAKLTIIANHMADGLGTYADDVRTRKLTVAQGSGTVHGNFYDLAEVFGITLGPYTET